VKAKGGEKGTGTAKKRVSSISKIASKKGIKRGEL